MKGDAVNRIIPGAPTLLSGCIQDQRESPAHSTENRNQIRANMPRIYQILALLAFAFPLLGQKTPYPTAWTQLFDNTGAPCSGCRLFTYVAGSVIPQATFTTPGGGAANSNPVVLDSAGTANIWTTPGQTYRFDLYDAANVLQRSVDNIPGGSLLGQSAVTANFVLAGPPTGVPATPTFRALVAADFPAFTPTICSNQFLTALSDLLAGTCTTATLASAQFANQGTTTTVLHGNAAGNPAWGPSVGADFGASIAARTGLGNPTAAVAAPAFSTTEDRLAYQVAEIPAFVSTATDFTTSGVGTDLELITGMSWTIPANTALHVPFACYFTYSQAVGNDAVAFGIQDVTVSPTNIAARGYLRTSTTASTAGNVPTLTTTTATPIVSATPGATATNYMAEISGFIEAPSNASSTQIRIMVSTATAADLVTIRKGSHCRIN